LSIKGGKWQVRFLFKLFWVALLILSLNRLQVEAIKGSRRQIKAIKGK
jgi:hypothetical protein